MDNEVSKAQRILRRADKEYVEIVRCKDCRYWRDLNDIRPGNHHVAAVYNTCLRMPPYVGNDEEADDRLTAHVSGNGLKNFQTPKDFYCSYGELKSEYKSRVDKIDKVADQFPRLKTFEEAKKLIKTIEKDLIYILPGHQITEQDWRRGNEIYEGYDISEEDMLSSLRYISDRWKAAFRIIWMLGLVNEDYR